MIDRMFCWNAVARAASISSTARLYVSRSALERTVGSRIGIESGRCRIPIPGGRVVSCAGGRSVSWTGGRAVSCGFWADAGRDNAETSANEQKSAARCTRYDRDARASGAGSQVHRPPVYFTR
jgi:hypothetical protein